MHGSTPLAFCFAVYVHPYVLFSDFCQLHLEQSCMSYPLPFLVLQPSQWLTPLPVKRLFTSWLPFCLCFSVEATSCSFWVVKEVTIILITSPWRRWLLLALSLFPHYLLVQPLSRFSSLLETQSQ